MAGGRYIWTGGTKMGVHFSRDMTLGIYRTLSKFNKGHSDLQCMLPIIYVVK